MKIWIYKDETITLDLQGIASGLNQLAPRYSFVVGTARFSVPDATISCPASYDLLDSRIDREASSSEMVILFTEKPYDNNYFFESNSNKFIVSLHGWEHLTSLPRNNGAVYFICALLVRSLGVGRSHRKKNTGCVNDFWRDKTGIDLGMRSGHICASCVRAVVADKAKTTMQLLDSVQAAFDDLSEASRSEQDVCSTWKAKGSDDAFDVFLCHNSLDKDAVRELSRRLVDSRVRTWLDEEQLAPGRAWQDLLEQQIQSVKTAAILVGRSGTGPWQNVETRAFIQEFVRRQCPVIPVILKDCETVPQLPLFLSQLTWVDFRKTSPDPYGRLLWGITGVRPTG